MVLVDITDPVATAPYETATVQDMEQTVKEVETHDRRAVAVTGDVRSQADLDAAVERGSASWERSTSRSRTPGSGA